MKKYIWLAVAGFLTGAMYSWAQLPNSALKDVDERIRGHYAYLALTARDSIATDQLRANDVIVEQSFVPPRYTTVNRPNCSSTSGEDTPKIIYNITTKETEICNDQDGSFDWDPLGLDSDRDGLKRRNAAGTIVDEDDDDANNQPVRGNFSIPDATVGNPGATARTVMYGVPAGVYGSGDEVSFTMPAVPYTENAINRPSTNAITGGTREFNATQQNADRVCGAAGFGRAHSFTTRTVTRSADLSFSPTASQIDMTISSSTTSFDNLNCRLYNL